MWMLIGAALANPSPAELATELSKVEAQLRDADLSVDEVRRVAMRQQALYRGLSGEAELQRAVLGALDSDTRWVVETNLKAGERIAHTVTNLKTTVPAWSIVAPPEIDVLLGYYREAEEKHGVPWEVVASIHLVETRMGRLQGTSWAGAQGPMQFMPKTWAAYGEGEVTDPHDAILAAGNYLGKMGAARDLDKAIWHYNHSDHYVKSVRGYASVLEKNPLAYRGYWGWQVFYRTQSGVVMLPEGYVQSEPVEVVAWCTDNRAHCPWMTAEGAP